MASKGFYPYQAPIDAYGEMGFRFAEMSHRGSLLCLPSGMHGWSVFAASELSLDSLQPALDCAAELDVLLIGLGDDISFLDPAIRDAFRAENVVVEATGTGSAVRTYNVLLEEKRAVGAALIAVERARRR